MLPYGFQDLTSDKAINHFQIQKKLTEFFIESGYELVLPSLIEYDGDESSINSMKLADPEDNKILKIRSDITEQISRIYKDKASKNAKFCYYGDIIYAKKDRFSGVRKLTQIGIENIENSSEKRDLQVLSLLIESLEKISITDCTIVIALPNLFNKFCELRKIGKERENIIDLLLEKNLSGIKASSAREIADFIIPKSDFKAEFKDKELNDIAENIIQLRKKILAKYKNIKIIIDPFDVRKYSYHTDYAFSVISHSLNKVIARGGSYNIAKNQSAAGFSCYLEELVSIILG